MVNYNNGKVYKIEPLCEHDEGDIYIGSTTKKYLSQRMDNHRNDYKRWKLGLCPLTTSYVLFDKYNVENCVIVLLDNVVANSKDELLAKEREYIKANKCVNRKIPLRLQKEYYDDNRDELLLKSKVYRSENLESLTMYQKDYYEKNKESIRQQQQLKYLEMDKDRAKAQRKQFYENNKVKILLHQKEIDEINKEKRHLRQKDYREKNREVINAKQREVRETNKDVVNARQRELRKEAKFKRVLEESTLENKT